MISIEDMECKAFLSSDNEFGPLRIAFEALSTENGLNVKYGCWKLFLDYQSDFQTLEHDFSVCDYQKSVWNHRAQY